MKIKVEKYKMKDEMLVSFCVPLELYRNAYLEREDYILDLIRKSRDKYNVKKYVDDRYYKDNLTHRLILDSARTLKLEEMLEKELTDKEKEEYELTNIYDNHDEDLIVRIEFFFLKKPIIQNDFDYKNIKLPKTLPETKEWYLKYLSSLLFKCGLLTKSSVIKLSYKHYGEFKYDLYLIEDFNANEYKLIEKDVIVKTFYEFDSLNKCIPELRHKLKNMQLNDTREFIYTNNKKVYLYKITLISIFNKNKSFYRMSPYLSTLYRTESYSHVIKYLIKILQEEIPYFNRLLLENSIKEHLFKNIIFNEISDKFVSYKNTDHLKPTKELFNKIHMILEHEFFGGEVFRTREEVYKREALKSTVFDLAIHNIAKKENIKINYQEILEEIRKYNNFDKDKYGIPYIPILIDNDCLTNYQISKLKNEILRRKVMDYLIDVNSNNTKVDPSWYFELGLKNK